jgi:hypothetical protein
VDVGQGAAGTGVFALALELEDLAREPLDPLGDVLGLGRELLLVGIGELAFDGVDVPPDDERSLRLRPCVVRTGRGLGLVGVHARPRDDGPRGDDCGGDRFELDQEHGA